MNYKKHLIAPKKLDSPIKISKIKSNKKKIKITFQKKITLMTLMNISKKNKKKTMTMMKMKVKSLLKEKEPTIPNTIKSMTESKF
jgi:hypothetical protein